MYMYMLVRHSPSIFVVNVTCDGWHADKRGMDGMICGVRRFADLVLAESMVVRQDGSH